MLEELQGTGSGDLGGGRQQGESGRRSAPSARFTVTPLVPMRTSANAFNATNVAMKVFVETVTSVPACIGTTTSARPASGTPEVVDNRDDAGATRGAESPPKGDSFRALARLTDQDNKRAWAQGIETVVKEFAGFCGARPQASSCHPRRCGPERPQASSPFP